VQELGETLDTQDLKDLLVLQELSASKDHKVGQASLVFRVLRAIRDILVSRVREKLLLTYLFIHICTLDA